MHQTWPKYVICGKTWLIHLRKKVLTKFVGNKKTGDFDKKIFFTKTTVDVLGFIVPVILIYNLEMYMLEGKVQRFAF